MEIQQRLIPQKHKHIRPGIPMKPRYITIHETANTAKGAIAEAHARLLERGNSRIASWHFTVDDHSIIQHLPENEVGWHAGDGRNGKGNRQSIGIEICVNSDGNFEKAQDNAVKLIQHLMSKHHISINYIVPHKNWSGKNCPANLLRDWKSFINKVKSSKPFTSTDFRSIKYTRLLKLRDPMMRGNDVKKVQQKLKVKSDGIYGPITKSAVMDFQKQHGLLVDGIVGPKTWTALFHEN